MPFKFEGLKIWQDALKLSNEMDILAQSFPDRERFSLCSQIKRAADSDVLNIAEGSTGQSGPEFKRFIGMALRSAIEVVSCHYMARDRKYITQDNFTIYYEQYELLCKMITAFRNTL